MINAGRYRKQILNFAAGVFVTFAAVYIMPYYTPSYP